MFFARLRLSLLILVSFLAVGVAPAAARTRRRPSRVALTITVTTPARVPAVVEVQTKRRRWYLSKAMAHRYRTFTLHVPIGTVRITARPIIHRGKLYVAARARLTVRIARKHSDRTVVRFAQPAVASDLVAGDVTADTLRLSFKTPRRAIIALRRTIGTTPAATPTSGAEVRFAAGRAVDTGLQPGSTYTYALFTRVHGVWEPPVTATAATVTASQYGSSSYTAPPTTQIEPASAVVSMTAGPSGPEVQLASDAARPPVGDIMIIPAGRVFAKGYLGQVQAVDANGTVTLAPATLAQAFTSYEINSGPGSSGSHLRGRAQSGGAGSASGSSSASGSAGGGGADSNSSGSTVDDSPVDCGSGTTVSSTLAPYVSVQTPTFSISDPSLGIGFFSINPSVHLNFSIGAAVGAKGDFAIEGAADCTWTKLDKPVPVGDIAGLMVWLDLGFEPTLETTGKATFANLDVSATAAVSTTVQAYLLQLPQVLSSKSSLTGTATADTPAIDGNLAFGATTSVSLNVGENLDAVGASAYVSGELGFPELKVEGGTATACPVASINGNGGLYAGLKYWAFGYGKYAQVALWQSEDHNLWQQGLGCDEGSGAGGAGSGSGSGSGSGQLQSTVTVGPIAPQTGTVGTSLALDTQASDSAGLSLMYTAQGLPDGLSIDAATGRIVGVPTSAGTYTVTVTVTASDGATGSAQFVWTVASSSSGGTPQQIVLAATADADTDNNWGGAQGDPSVLAVYGGQASTSGDSRSLINFDIPAPPAGDELQSAVLNVYETHTGGTNGLGADMPNNWGFQPVDVFAAAQPWSEASVPSLPGYGAEASESIVPNGSSGGPGWHTVDVTSLVQQGVPNGFVLIAAQDDPTYVKNGSGICFAGRSQTGFAPQLTLTYVPVS